MKNVIKLENYYLPWELERVIAEWVEYYNNTRLHEALDNITPADMYHGRKEEILTQRQITKQKTLLGRKRINLKHRHQVVSIT
jgi:putative transposase